MAILPLPSLQASKLSNFKTSSTSSVYVFIIMTKTSVSSDWRHFISVILTCQLSMSKNIRIFLKHARKGFRPPGAMKGFLRNVLENFWVLLGILLEYFRRIFLERFFWRNFLEEMFWEDIFLWGFFCEDFFVRIFLWWFLGGIFLGDFFGRILVGGILGAHFLKTSIF